MEQMRINKYLARCGVCSRRDADRRVAEGKILVNGKVPSPGQSIGEGDRVTVSGRPLKAPDRTVVLAFYKPVGVTCTERDSHAERKITDLVHYPVRVTYAGRLDKESEGLLLLSNDGDLIQAMMRGENGHEKEYLVKVDREVTEAFIRQMGEGVYLKELDQTTRKCRVERLGKYTFRMVLTQGLNRQIRRMCAHFGYETVALKRIRVMQVGLRDLKPGEYYELEEPDIERLRRACGISTGSRIEEECRKGG